MAPKRPVNFTVPKSSVVQPTTVKDMQQMMENFTIQIRVEMKKILEENNKILRQDIVLALKGVASALEKLNSHVDEVAEKVELMEGKIESMERDMENEILMLQYGQMEYALRIRGLEESLQEDLKEMVAKDFAVILNKEKEGILSEIEKLFRVNSAVAVQKNLPRDVVIYFGKKSLRNEIIQAFYKKRFQIASQDVIILKEIPSKILRRRKEFAFLANELKMRRISFRWDVPIGMVVNYLGICYRLNTVFQAKDFYTSVLGVCSSSPIKFKTLEEMDVELQFEDSKIGQPLFKRSQHVQIEEQETTCVLQNCKEKQQLKKSKEISHLVIADSVGEARSINPLEQSSRMEGSLEMKKGKSQPEGRQQLEKKGQRKICATYNCKEKDQQKDQQNKELKESPQVLAFESLGDSENLEQLLWIDPKAFVLSFMTKTDNRG